LQSGTVRGSATAAADGTYTIGSLEPFGKAKVAGAANSNSLKYTGREDDGTGLYYYRNRYYSPTSQRFISADPFGLAGCDANLYAYVGNSPMAYLDPLGLARVYYWAVRVYPNGRGSLGFFMVGHIAMRLDDGTYISLWPDGPHKDYLDDIEAENRQATRIYRVDGLDEASIKRWWDQYKDQAKWKYNNNCADTVAQALYEGARRAEAVRLQRQQLYARQYRIRDVKGSRALAVP
jgi:RHS repeat-associated protein